MGSLFNRVGPIVQRENDVGIGEPSGPGEDSGHEFARARGGVAHPVHIAIDAVLQDTGDVVGVVERTSRNQQWQFGVNIKTSTLHVS